MNKISNLSMMVLSLLFLCTSISNVYGVDPRKFKLNFGTLTNRIDDETTQFEGLYYQIECSQNEDGEGKTIWKSTIDGYDYTEEDEDILFLPIDINGGESKLTPWHIESRDYFYNICDLYLYKINDDESEDDIKGHGYINLEEYTNMAKSQNVILNDPENFRSPAHFDVDISGESEIYDGEWKYNFELRIEDIRNLNTVTIFRNLYYQLECNEDLDKVELTIFKCIEDGYDWEYYQSKGTKIYVMPFTLYSAMDSDEMPTHWLIDTKNKDDEDLYFFNCDLYIMQIGTMTTSYLAKSSSIPLNSFGNDQTKLMEMYFYKIGDDEGKEPPMFYLRYYASQIKERKMGDI